MCMQAVRRRRRGGSVRQLVRHGDAHNHQPQRGYGAGGGGGRAGGRRGLGYVPGSRVRVCFIMCRIPLRVCFIVCQMRACASSCREMHDEMGCWRRRCMRDRVLRQPQPVSCVLRHQGSDSGASRGPTVPFLCVRLHRSLRRPPGGGPGRGGGRGGGRPGHRGRVCAAHAGARVCGRVWRLCVHVCVWACACVTGLL